MTRIWREYEHPRNPDGTFRDKATASSWMDHVIGAFFPGEETETRMSRDVFAGDVPDGDDPDWEHDPGEQIWDETPIEQDLHLVKRVGGGIELAAYHDNGDVTPLMHFNDKQARVFNRDFDFVDGIGDYDRGTDYYSTAVDEYGLLTHVRTGSRVIGMTPEGDFKIITLMGSGANSVRLGRDSMRKLAQQMAEYESWGEGYEDEDEE